MNILIRQARLIAANHPSNNKVMDILIEGGKITEIKKSIPAKGNLKVIEGEGLCVSEGWMDLQAVGCDPGFEHREDLDTLVDCAAAGGFTAVCVHSFNQPALHGKSQIEYVVNKTRNRVVEVLPLGTVTMDAKGKDLAELYDMKQSGAVAFSDYKHPLKESGSLLRAILYANNINALVMAHCSDESIAQGGQMNEGETAVAIGLRGIPALAEEIMLERNLSILEYTGGRLHIPLISTKGSADIIKKARASGLQVSAGVSSLHLLLDDTLLKDFDSNYKLNPPLRSKKDVQALRNAVTSGIIQVIVSDHCPMDPESKELEFDLADHGAINLQTCFPAALAALGEENIGVIVNAFTRAPREILGLAPNEIAEGATANLTIFSLCGETVFTEKSNRSKSANSPFFNKTLKGKVIGIVNGGKNYFN